MPRPVPGRPQREPAREQEPGGDGHQQRGGGAGERKRPRVRHPGLRRGGAGPGLNPGASARAAAAVVTVERVPRVALRHAGGDRGHQAGDRLLKAAGAAWSASLRKTDVLVRYGGEEFAVLLPECRLADAMAIAERLRTAVPEGTCSIGVAEWARGETADELLGRADQALYAAKDGGRDRCCASPSPTASRRRILERSSGPSGWRRAEP
jgi:hypothetical protein